MCANCSGGCSGGCSGNCSGGCSCKQEQVDKLNKYLCKTTHIFSVSFNEDEGYVFFNSELQEDSFVTKDFEKIELFVAGFMLGKNTQS